MAEDDKKSDNATPIKHNPPEKPGNAKLTSIQENFSLKIEKKEEK